MKTATIQCRKCNQNFKSMLSFIHHICLKEKNSPKWNGSISSRNRSPQKYWDKSNYNLPLESKKHLKKIKLDKLSNKEKK